MSISSRSEVRSSTRTSSAASARLTMCSKSLAAIVMGHCSAGAAAGRLDASFAEVARTVCARARAPV
eukprot:3449066-Lingulodinium_polyedra.AAC.1